MPGKSRQYATVGKFHLAIAYIQDTGLWGWTVVRRSGNTVQHAGEADSLEEAKAAALQAAEIDPAEVLTWRTREPKVKDSGEAIPQNDD